MANRAAPRILTYSQDGFGLGHLRRTLNICLQIKKRCPEAAILIIADSPVAPFFKLPPKCDFVKIPTIVKVDTGVWRSERLSMGYQELLAIRSDIIQNVALSFKPDVFLVDHMPHGAFGELSHPLQAIRKESPHTRMVLGIRDILGAPDVIIKQWRTEGAFAAAEEFYDAVCVYGCADVFDVISEYQFPPALAHKTAYSGYVCRDEVQANSSAAFLQGLFKEADLPFVLVTGGGGADSAFFMDQYLEAVRVLHPEVRFNTFLSVGPFLHKAQCELLYKKAKGLPVVVSKMGQDSIRLLRRAHLVVSMAGYNTISEIMRFRKRAIIVPRAGPSAEQTMRTRIMSDRGLFTALHPTVLTPAKLAATIAQQLWHGNGMNETLIPDLCGASRTAARILAPEFAEEEAQVSEASSGTPGF